MLARMETHIGNQYDFFLLRGSRVGVTKVGGKFVHSTGEHCDFRLKAWEHSAQGGTALP